MKIDIMECSKIKGFFQKLCSRAEGLLFSVIQKLPEKFIPQSLMEWLGNTWTGELPA